MSLRVERLRERRKAAGMTLKKLSELSRVSVDTIHNIETGKSQPKAETLQRLQQVLKIKIVVSERCDTWRAYEPPPPPPRPSFRFELGHVYSIRDHNFGGAYADGISPQYGTLCEFRYEGKRGIHHYFREVKGGWSRTYTDTQLIGKEIKEVMECTR